jgi:hypothetical protein
MPRAATAVLLLALVSCGDTQDANLRYFFSMRWAFADGRSCADAGVMMLRLTSADGGLILTYLPDCESGRIGNPQAAPQQVGQLPGGDHPYYLDALTPSGGVLYRAHFEVDPSMRAELDLTLDFVGGS